MATKSMGTLTLNLVMQMGGFEQGADRAERAMEKLNASAQKQVAGFERLASSIDPLFSQLTNLEKLQTQLSSFGDSGMFNPRAIEILTERLGQMRQSAFEANSALAAQAQEVTSVVAKLDPLAAKYEEINRLQSGLKIGAATGQLSTEEVTRYTAALDQMKAKLDASTPEAVFERQYQEARKLQQAGEYVQWWNTQLEQMDQKEKAAAEGVDFERQYQEARKLQQAGEYVQWWNQQIDASQANERLAAEYNTISREIDPLRARLSDLAAMQEKVKAAFSAGVINEQQFTKTSTELSRQIGYLEKQAAATRENTISVKQYQQALRGMPAQITDIVVSLQAGQNPLTVFLQQGGQIKDMFGGIGPALSGMGRAVLGMINPVTLATVALGALGIAAVKGMNETAALGKSLAATGNSVGMTAGQLQAMAEGIDAVSESVTQSAASEVLVALVRDGRVAAGSMREVAEAIALMAATGEGDVAKLIEAFGKMKDDPVKAITELNKAYNFLTPAIYDQIRALKEQGQEEEAIRLAQETAAAAIKQRATEVVDQAGYMERAWKTVATVAKGAWDAMLGIGRPVDQLDRLLDQRAFAVAGGATEAEVAAIDRLIAVQQGLREERQREAKAQADQREETDAYVKAQEAVAKAHDSSRSAVDKANESLKRYREQLAVIRKANPNAPELDPALIARTEASIMAGAAVGKGRSSSGKDPLDAQLREMERAAKLEADLYRDRNQIIELYNSQNLLSIAEYYDAQRVALEENTATQQAALDAQIALLRGKKDAQDKINALVAEGFALEREASIRMTELNLRQSGAEEQKRIADAMERVNDVRTEASDILSQLQRDEERINIARQIGAEGELGSLARLGEARRKAYDALKAQIDLYDRLEAIDPAGMTEKQQKALEKIGPQIDALRLQAEKLAADLDPLGDKISGIFEDAFADAFTDFVTGAKTASDAFRAFGNAVVSQLIRIAAQQAASSIFGSGLGGLLSSLVSAAFGAGGSTGPSAAAGGGSWLGDTSGFKLNGMRAEGGPVNPYGTYLVGEEGPELLQMGGRSGVVIPNDQMLGSGGGATVNVYNAPPGTTTRSSKRDGREFVEVFLADIAKGGEMAQAMQGAFNLSRTGR